MVHRRGRSEGRRVLPPPNLQPPNAPPANPPPASPMRPTARLAAVLLAAVLLAGPACERDEPAPAAPGDQTPPEVAILSPADGARVADTLKVLAQVADRGGVARVSLLLDGRPRLIRHGPPWIFAYPCSAAADGQAHELRLEASDRAGNLATCLARHVVLCPNRAPRVWIEHPADQLWIERGAPEADLPWRARAQDPDEGVLPADALRWRLDGQALPDTGSSIPPPPLEPGPHRLEVWVADGWGRMGSAAVTFRVFDPPPADSPEGAWEALLATLRARETGRLAELTAADLRFHPCTGEGGIAGAPWPRMLWLDRLAAFVRDPRMASLRIEATGATIEHLTVNDLAWAKLEVRSLQLQMTRQTKQHVRRYVDEERIDTETSARIFLRRDPAGGLWRISAWWDLHDSRWSTGRGPSMGGLLEEAGAED